MMVSQAHTRIFELQKRGYRIEASDFKDEFGFKSYRLIDRELPEPLTEHPDYSDWIQQDKVEQAEKLNL